MTDASDLFFTKYTRTPLGAGMCEPLLRISGTAQWTPISFSLPFKLTYMYHFTENVNSGVYLLHSDGDRLLVMRFGFPLAEKDFTKRNMLMLETSAVQQ